MTKRYLIPALTLSSISAILLVLITISTPTTLSDSTPFDFVRSTHLGGIIDLSPSSNPNRLISNVKFGTWGYCTSPLPPNTTTTTSTSTNYACFKHSHGYSVRFGINPDAKESAARESVVIGSSWTRGLAVHVVAFVVALVGLALVGVSRKQVVRLAALVVNGVAALLALVGFAVDVALLVYVQRQMGKVSEEGGKTMPGPAFYMALVEVFVAVCAAVMAGLNWRSERLDRVVVGGYDYPQEGGEGGWRRYEGHQMQPTSASSELGSASAQKVLDAYEESKHT